MSDVKRYSGQMMLGDTSIPAGFMRGMVKGEDYDALLAELEGERENAKEWLVEHYALQAERDQLRAELEAANKRADINAWNHRHAKQDLQTARNRIAELEAIRGQQVPEQIEVATLLAGDPYDERDGCYLSVEDSQRLAALPAGTKLYVVAAAPPKSR